MGDDDKDTRLLAARPADWTQQKGMLDRVHVGLFGKPGRSLTLGRYVLLETIGSGGAGVVYAAYDPQLDRKVAVKLVHAGGGAEDSTTARDRLLREARALAQLSHPNIVAVHDFGTIDRSGATEWPGDGCGADVFIVMELVAGRNLRQWALDEQPGWRRVLEVLLPAGRGLAAAHARGLVHRDFKPSNVVVGDDGRARVLDFGLVRPLPADARDDEGLGSRDAPAREPGGDATASDPLTEVGTVMGTPRYMAPEQHAGAIAGPAADQYAFCVSLWELLDGTPPFRGSNLADLARRKNALEPAELASKTVPRLIHDVLARGLAPSPADRFPNMDALVEGFERRLQRHGQRRGLAIVGGVVLVVTTMMAVVPSSATVCDADEIESDWPWNEPTRAMVRDAFLVSGAAYADTAWRRVDEHMAGYRTDWLAQRDTACREGLRKDGSISAMSRRMLCLDRLQTRVQGLVALYRRADAKMVETAVETMASVPPPASCAQGDQARDQDSPEPSRLDRGQLLALEAGIVAVDGLMHAGRIPEAVTAAEEAIERVEATGDPSVRARAYLARGRLEQARGRGTEAHADLLRAMELAEQAGDDRVWVEAVTVAVFVTGRQLARYGEAVTLARLARARIERRGLHWLLPELDFNLGRTLEAKGDLEQAIVALRRSLESVKGEADPLVGELHLAMGVVADRRGEWNEALRSSRTAWTEHAAVFGARHPKTGLAQGNVGSALLGLGRDEEAVPVLEEAVAILDETVGDHPGAVFHLETLASALLEVGRHEEAIERHLRAVDMAERLVGTEHPWYAHALVGLAGVESRTGNSQGALEHAMRAADIVSRYPGSPMGPPSELVLARALHGTARYAQALERYRGALRAHEHVNPDHPMRARILVGMAEVHLELGDIMAATPLLEDALAIQRRHHRPTREIARTQLILARALPRK